MRSYIILFACLIAPVMAQTPPMTTTPHNRPMPAVTPIIPMAPVMNPNTMYYYPDDRRFYNPQRADPDFSNLKPPPMGYHYELRDKEIILVRN